MLGVLAAAALAGAYAPPPGIAALAPYEGRWKLEVHSLGTHYGKAGSRTTIVANRCLRFLDHLACGQNVDGKDAGLVVFSFDPATGRYSSLIIDQTGAGHAGQLTRDGGRFLFPWVETHDGATVSFRVVNVFRSPTEIAYSKEYALDGRNWSVIEQGVETKEPAAQTSTSR